MKNATIELGGALSTPFGSFLAVQLHGMITRSCAGSLVH